MISFVYLFILFLISYYFYVYKKIHWKFHAAGLKYLPGVPVFGNLLKSTFLRRHFIYDMQEVYEAFQEEKYVGLIDGIQPVILVRDPDIMKLIVIKNFDHFRNRKHFFPVRLDPLLGRNIVQLIDGEWKTVRSSLSPAFTGSRLRAMTPALVYVCKNTIQALKNGPMDVDIQDFMSRFCVDAIALAAFGFNQEKPGADPGPFFDVGDCTQTTGLRKALSFVSIQYPRIGEFLKMLGIQLYPSKIHTFVRKVVAEAMEYRKNNPLSIPDYMDVLCKKLEGRPIDDIAGQVMFALDASFESAGNILSACFYELMLNPEVQERLYQEIRNNEKAGGDVSMDSIIGLKYLDCVYNEVARLWAASVVMDRVCTKSFLLPPPREGGKPYLVNPGDVIYNAITPLHIDPKYFPDPHKFDPDRFSQENRHKIKIFMPFGMGPRSCIAERLMVLLIKVMMYHMLLNFKLEKSKKTSDTIKVIPDDLNMRSEGGTWLRLIPRC